MSSEMREVDAFEAWARAQCFGSEELRRIEGRPANTFGLTWEYNGDSVQAAWAAWLERALLARTEAGADGVSIWRYRFRNSETGGWHEWRYSDRQPVLNSLVADKTEIQGPFTRPQDASGDAVTGRVNGYMFSARAIEIITDGEVPEWITKAPGLRVTITAMQAKEAK